MLGRLTSGFFRAVLALALLAVGCSNSEFAGSSQNSVSTKDCKKNPKLCTRDGGGGGEGTIEPDGPTKRDFQKNEAVLAVRDISCALCHSSIDANIITDFAMSTDDASAEQTYRKLMYQVNHEMGANGQPIITGDFIVPRSQTPMTEKTSVDCVFSAEKVADSSPKSKVSILDNLTKCAQNVFKWGATSQKFVGKESISINPVSSADDIRSIVGSAKLSKSGFALVGDSKLSGISGSSQTGFTAASAVTCEGAVVFDGPVVLKDSTVNTEKGCRIYSTASIFVFGNTRVSTNSDTANLQLMSPLFVGFDISSGNVDGRLKNDANSKLKLSRGSAVEVAALITADANKLGIASNTGNSNVGYSRVVASAPVVYSRHTGPFSGAIIAEHFIGKIGALSFTFDPIFKAGTTAIFPEIKRALVLTR